MVEQDEEPNTESDQQEREREREVHRAQLEAVRAAFAAPREGAEPDPDSSVDAYRTEYLVARLTADMRRLDHSQRNTTRFVAALAVALVVGALTFALLVPYSFDGVYAFDEISARSIRADRVALTGDLRLEDAAGNELAALGRGPGAAGDDLSDRPVVLSLNAEGDPDRPLVHLAASKAGARLTLETPTGASSVSVLSTSAGSAVEVRDGDQTQLLSGESVGPVTDLPPVAAGPMTTGETLRVEHEVPAFTPRHGAPPSSGLPEVRDVGHGFLIADLSARPVADGVELRGRMVNTTAVVHNALAFRISMGDASATLTIPKISPGNSTGFRIKLPGAAGAPMGDAKVEYLGSTVAFQAASTEPVYGRRAEVK